ncbi:cyclase family protein [Streptomyces sp. ID01-12c]|uniref:Cyclase family protein n=1 Tax=Streptomyces caniscabiei TaxID=2746961 RepID=A0A927QLN8_9ACTN|nr:cyclase family protein [Streptomyces caniscabiei]MBD9700820.1 cyclase family protein [Streptomyces caniscabiei]MBD9725024.1 cyclase family protein [Streptomyces caniscabiei]MDX3510404.1 cyclase family protein [Streptomyces caniscabiei]MDX3720487.1 cyclase family protein [Streptomyces caniscabiei]MDX3727634.1 cyclase family protein [Streptomyces caniscabiei]
MSSPTEFAAFTDIAKRVNNWGRWGADDEIGTLNLITDEVVREAAASVRSGRRVPLALPLQQDGVQTGMMPGRVNPLHAMVQINQEIFGPGTVACSDDAVTMGLQAATHWDALTHVSHSGRIYNGRPADTITPHGGAAFAGIDKARHIVSRGVLLDIPRALGLGDDRLPGGHAVTPEDLDAAEELAGTRVRAGDIVLVRTGQIRTYLTGDKHAYAFPSPGLSLRTPEWFHARDVAAVANDTLTFEIFPPEVEDLWLPVHALDLVEMGMPQGQNWNLEELSTACGQAGRYDFLLSAMPEPFVGATGTPVAPIAIL